MRPAYWTLGGAIALGALVAPLSAQQAAGSNPVHAVTQYDGKYVDDAAITKILKGIVASCDTGLDVVCEALGVRRASVDARRITVVLTDASSGTEARFPDVNQAAAFTAFRPDAHHESASIVLFTEWLARPQRRGMLGFDGILRHELAHAVLAQGLPPRTVLPAWVEEGLAVWASGDGPTFVRRTAHGRALRRRMQSVCDGLESRVEQSHGGGDYAEDYLAFAYLEKLGGEGSVAQYVTELRAGKSFTQAIRATVARGWAAFHAGARIHATAALTGQDDPSLKASIGVLRLARDRKDRQTLAAATTFLADHGDTVDAGAVLFARAAALTNLRKYGAGRAAFEQSLKRGSIFDDACCFYIATIHNALRQPGKAVAWFERLARDHPESPRMPDAMFDLGFAMHATGQKAAARKLLAKCLATWPQPRNPKRLERARRLLGGG